VLWCLRWRGKPRDVNPSPVFNHHRGITPCVLRTSSALLSHSHLTLLWWRILYLGREGSRTRYEPHASIARDGVQSSSNVTQPWRGVALVRSPVEFLKFGFFSPVMSVHVKREQRGSKVDNIGVGVY
jgi:hypothetical protein